MSLSDDLLTTKREVCTGGRKVKCKRGAHWLLSDRILEDKSEPRALCGEQQARAGVGRQPLVLHRLQLPSEGHDLGMTVQ